MRKDPVKFAIIFLVLYFLTLLVPAFMSINHVPASNFYIIIWLLFTVVFYPKFLFSREFKACLSFLIIHIIYLIINHYKDLNLRVTETLGEIFIAVAFALSLWYFLRIPKEKKLLRTLAFILLSFIILTSVTTLIGLISFPYAARELIGNPNAEEVRFLLGLNVGSYHFQYLLVFVSPLFLYFYISKKKFAWLGGFLLTTTVVLYAQIVAAIILLIVNIGLTLMLSKNISLRRYVILIVIGILFYAWGKPVISSFFRESAQFLSQFEQISDKFSQLSGYFEQDKPGTKEGDIHGYNIRFEKSYKGFLKSPFIGGESSGGHHFWMDNLAEHGIIGTIPWLFVFIYFLKTVWKKFDEENRILILNSVIIFFLIGTNKNILIYTMLSSLFFVVPLLLSVYNISPKKKKHRKSYKYKYTATS